MSDKNQSGQNQEKEGFLKPAVNPFTNDQTADKDIEQAKDELDKEQAFKEASTERD